MKSGNRDLLDRLAAEYVLGTLRHRARRRFERWLVSPQVEALVKAWEERLAGLEPPLEAVTPPGAVWHGIEEELELRKLARAPARRWMAVAASLLLLAFAGVLVERWSSHPALVATQRAFIEENPETIYWRVELLGDNQEIALHVHKVHELPPGKSMELWAVPAQGAPVSLGLLPTTGDAHRVLTATQREALRSSRQLAVSLEPAGGSPTGHATGPVLLVAPIAPV